jgi:hypothetical protein
LDTAKAVVRGKFIAKSAYIKRTERSQWPNATSQTPTKKEAKNKISRRREIIKIRAEMNEIETTTKKSYKESMKQKTVSLKNKQDWQTPGKPD